MEDAIGDAFRNFNNAGLLGSVVVIMMVAFVFQFRFLNKIIEELRAELREEREAHQKTRDAQIVDIRNLGHVASSVDGMRSSMDDLNQNMRELIYRRNLP